MHQRRSDIYLLIICLIKNSYRNSTRVVFLPENEIDVTDTVGNRNVTINLLIKPNVILSYFLGKFNHQSLSMRSIFGTIR